MSGYAMIPVDKNTRELLKSYGSKGETYDQLIRRLIALAEQSHLLETHYQRLGEKDRFVKLEDL
jgi:hypothetical protein